MKLGEIKLESLRLMGVNDENLILEKIDNYKQDDLYREYLERMNGAINRAISRLMMFKAIPLKKVEVTETQSFLQFIKFDLNTIVPDLNSIERVLYIDKYNKIKETDFETLGSEVMIENLKDYQSIIVEYSPKVESITDQTSEDKELAIPETMARMIPYFVKGELYETDEPEISATARNIFESALSEFVSYGKPKKAKQNYVKNVMY